MAMLLSGATYDEKRAVHLVDQRMDKARHCSGCTCDQNVTMHLARLELSKKYTTSSKGMDDLPLLEEVLQQLQLHTQLSKLTDLDDEVSLPDDDAPQIDDDGTRRKALDLYPGPGSDQYVTNWVEEFPEGFSSSLKDKEEFKSHAIVVKHKFNDKGEFGMHIHSINVQSPLLKSVLKEIFQDYPELPFSSFELEEVEFHEPFWPFVHRWDEFDRAAHQEPDTDATKDTQLLYNILHKELEREISRIQDLIDHGLIDFDHIWALFRPGELILDISQHGFGVWAHIFSVGHYQVGQFALTSDFVDWNGEHFGIAKCYQVIGYFKGTKPITDLALYPMKFHPSPGPLRTTLVQRGRRFEALQGCKYKTYKGTAKTSGFGARTTSGRIIIDCKAYLQSSGAYSVLEKLPEPANGDSETFSSALDLESCLDVLQDISPSGEPVEHEWTVPGQPNVARLSEEHLLLCSPILKGYCLSSKEWAVFDVDGVSGLRWNDEAFPSLVLPGDYKELIFAFVSSQFQHNESFDDVIAGKGQGIIMLLSGKPGLGKTLTAEAVAEEMRAPLYSLSAGELGESASSIEDTLTVVLELVTKWNAVLLLDEADVFLEQRDFSNLARNKIVSIFLRMLEYYKGILFLTTNRVSTFDQAFESRIHLRLHYPDLNIAARKVIWTNLLRKSQPPAQLSIEEITELAGHDVNGRQIKNIVKTSQLLAASKRESLAIGHVRSVLRITKNALDL
ncbi:P-loop containing nucleoside triphosphate hydrolase protein [Hyaloscypha variabilis]